MCPCRHCQNILQDNGAQGASGAGEVASAAGARCRKDRRALSECSRKVNIYCGEFLKVSTSGLMNNFKSSCVRTDTLLVGGDWWVGGLFWKEETKVVENVLNYLLLILN